MDVTGVYYTDKVCLSPTADGCVAEQEFLAVTNQRKTYGPYDGIMGLQPTIGNLFSNLVAQGYY